jgi:hypothetical protein
MSGNGNSPPSGVAYIDNDNVRYQRPEPPEELTDEEAVEWVSIVEKMPPEYFTPPTWPVLVNLCQHICLARAYKKELAAFTGNYQIIEDLKIFNTLRAMFAKESLLIAALSRALALTKSSNRETRAQSARRRAFQGQRAPWEIAGRQHDLTIDADF